MRVLAVSDEVVAGLWTPRVRRPAVDLVLAAGDLPFDYLEYLAGTLDRPVVFVPGNHDADLSAYRQSRGGLWTRGGMPAGYPGPGGAVNADGRVVDVAGLRIAGLGGSRRYNDGPNQWTERQQSHRAARLRLHARVRGLRRSRPVDVLLTHAPPRHCGDREDAPHRGFECLHGAVRALRPRLLLHGHIHPFGQPVPDRTLGATTVCNVVGHRVLELGGPGGAVGGAPGGRERSDAR